MRALPANEAQACTPAPRADSEVRSLGRYRPNRSSAVDRPWSTSFDLGYPPEVASPAIGAHQLPPRLRREERGFLRKFCARRKTHKFLGFLATRP